MSTETLKTPPPTNPPATAEAHAQPPAQPKHVAMSGTNFARVIAAEFRKMFSLRSTWWLVGIAIVVMIGFAFLGALSLQLLRESAGMAQSSGSMNMEADPQMQALLADQGVHAALAGSGYQIALVLLGAVAVLTATGEFSTGSIRSTLLATPKRGQVVLAKALVVSVVTVAVMFVGLLLSHYAIWAQMADFKIAEHFFTPDQWWQYMVIILFTLASVLLGLGLGLLLRSSAGAIVTLLILIVLMPIVWMFFPGEVMENIGGYLPANLAGTAMALQETNDFPNRAAAMGLFFGWGLLGMIIGATRFMKSDVK